MSDVTHLRARYLRQPHEVSIETWALCNAACTFCPYPSLDRKGTRLATGSILTMIAQMAVWTEPFFVSLFKVNEPLLDDRLEAFCSTVVERCPQATLRLFTNGSPLTSRHVDWIRDLPRGRLAHLWVSLNSTDEEEYYELMKIKFSVTAKRLDELHERVRQVDFEHPVVLSRVMQDTDMTPRGRSSALFKWGPKDGRFILDCHERWPRFQMQLIKRDGWLGYVDPSSTEIPQSPCFRWFELNITAEGKAALCCMDGTGEFSVGDIATSSLLEIYNQPHLLARREFSATRTGIEPCERCTY